MTTKKQTGWLTVFIKNDYEISGLLEDIFTSEWFYDEKNIGNKIKSPVELLVGIQRMLPMKLENEEALMILQRLLGQVLFYPPNVAGWPGGKSWIDSSSLMMRMRIPKLINDIDELNVKPKSDDDTMMGRKDESMEGENKPSSQGGGKKMAGYAGIRKQQINADVDWNIYVKTYEKVSRENLVNSIASTLLQVKSTVGPELVKGYSDESSRENFIKTATLQVMSMPEYQLC